MSNRSIELEATLRLALEALEKLWNIIDDIDTYGDMAKGDEKLYRALVERRQRTRFEETGISTDGYELTGGAVTAIKEALNRGAMDSSPNGEAQPAVALEQRSNEHLEPVAYLVMGPYEKTAFSDIGSANAYCRGLNKGFDTDAYIVSPLYTTPPPVAEPHKRKPLTDEQIMNIAKVSCIGISPHEDTLNFAKVIEAVHGIKGDA